MMFGALLWLTLSVAQVGGADVPVSAKYDEVRADAVMRRAWRGRAEAIRRICADQSRVKRLRALDGTFALAQQAYQRRFGGLWQGRGVVSEGRLGVENTGDVSGALSRDTNIDPRCQSPGGFAGALGEYQNGVTLALAEFGG